MNIFNRLLIVCCLMGNVVAVDAQNIETSKHNIMPELKISFIKKGVLRPRSTQEIASSNWIIGCETLDRDMADYDQYKAYIAPLGIKRLRMQAGWAKTEKVNMIGNDWIKLLTMPTNRVFNRG